MTKVIANGVGFSIIQDGDTVLVSVQADKLPVRGGYGHTFESGNTTRAYARMVARKHVPGRAPNSYGVNVSAMIDTYNVGTDVWRTYRVLNAEITD